MVRAHLISRRLDLFTFSSLSLSFPQTPHPFPSSLSIPFFFSPLGTHKGREFVKAHTNHTIRPKKARQWANI